MSIIHPSITDLNRRTGISELRLGGQRSKGITTEWTPIWYVGLTGVVRTEGDKTGKTGTSTRLNSLRPRVKDHYKIGIHC